MKKLGLLFLIVFASVTVSIPAKTLEPPEIRIERRAAVDVGSGGTKVAIADVDLQTGKVVQVVFEESFSVPYQAALGDSIDGSFDEEIQELALHTFRQIQELVEEHQVQKIAAVATAAFREANNGLEFAEEVKKKTGIPLRVISQHEEGEIAFFSALAVSDEDPEGVIVWDIGTGSLQITTAKAEEDLLVFKAGVGAIVFRNYVIDVVQESNSNWIDTPNPMSDDDWKFADRYARAIARKATPYLKEKLKQDDTVVLGIGRLFYHSVRPMVTDGDIITRKGLRSFIRDSLEKTDLELGDPYSDTNVSNAMLVLAVMKALHIQKIKAIETTSTKGILLYWPDWEEVEEPVPAL